MKHVRKHSYSASYKSKNFQYIFSLFRASNPDIKNIDLIFENQEINIPADLNLGKNELTTNYKVRPGDTIYGILGNSFSSQDIHEMAAIMMVLNPSLENIDLIIEGEVLKIPTKNYVGEAKVTSKERIPASKVSVDEEHELFEFNFLLEEEIYYLPGIKAQIYIEVFRSIVGADHKETVVEGLQKALDKSRELKHRKLEIAFLELISTGLKSQNDNAYLMSLRSFFERWKSLRKQRNKNHDGRKR